MTKGSKLRRTHATRSRSSFSPAPTAPTRSCTRQSGPRSGASSSCSLHQRSTHTPRKHGAEPQRATASEARREVPFVVGVRARQKRCQMPSGDSPNVHRALVRVGLDNRRVLVTNDLNMSHQPNTQVPKPGGAKPMAGMQAGAMQGGQHTQPAGERNPFRTERAKAKIPRPRRQTRGRTSCSRSPRPCRTSEEHKSSERGGRATGHSAGQTLQSRQRATTTGANRGSCRGHSLTSCLCSVPAFFSNDT
jgi:hypothetical protein